MFDANEHLLDRSRIDPAGLAESRAARGDETGAEAARSALLRAWAGEPESTPDVSKL
jgi:hypothetical protein